jgi:cation diffusion facilitator CzcD-associated flavoprotein CzcO
MGSIDHQDGAEAKPSAAGTNSDYVVKEEPLGTLRRVRVVTIGAGLSGINMIRTLRLNTSNFEHVVYEKNPDIGGTWFENQYPGCACDVPSHNYQFSHTPNPGWTSLFSESGEIQSYLQHVCDKHGLREYIKLSHSVTLAQWDEEFGKWILKIRDEVAGTTFEDRCDFLLDATGILKYVPPLVHLCTLTIYQ